jgi:large subunit ribosomal protein L17
MFRNMVTSLMVHGRIKTTKQRAKELRRVAERVISVGKRAPSLTDLEGLEGEALQQAKADRVAAIRRMKLWVNNDDAIQKLMGEYADRFRTRPGGYTRVVKLSRRRAGDNAEMAIIELVEEMAAAAS